MIQLLTRSCADDWIKHSSYGYSIDRDFISKIDEEMQTNYNRNKHLMTKSSIRAS